MTHTIDTLMEAKNKVYSDEELQKIALKNLNYVNGDLYWKPDVKWVQFRGKKAGSMEAKGYYVVGIGGKIRKLHRVVFLMHHGYFPKIVDHINGNKLYNRIENLRAATHSQNTVNCGVRKNTKSGLKGVSQVGSGRWQATIRCEMGRKYLGVYDTPEFAHAAYAAAAQLHHKEFARTV